MYTSCDIPILHEERSFNRHVGQLPPIDVSINVCSTALSFVMSIMDVTTKFASVKKQFILLLI